MSQAHNELAYYVIAHITEIVNALEIHARSMDEAAKNAQAEYERGQADPEVRAAQDKSLMTNNGYFHSAVVFRRESERSLRIASQVAGLARRVEDGDG